MRKFIRKLWRSLLLKKLLIILLSLLIFVYVLFFVPPPSSWFQADTWKILAFFLPILSCVTFLLYIFIRNFAVCFLIGSLTLILLVLKAADSFQPLYVGGTVLCFAVLIYIYSRYPLKTLWKIPRLTKIRRSDKI
jgi:hypothetical protein